MINLAPTFRCIYSFFQKEYHEESIDSNLVSIFYKYRPLSNKNLLFNLIFSSTLAGLIEAIDLYMKGLPEALWRIFPHYVINFIWIWFGFLIFSYPISALIQKLNTFLSWNENWIRRLLLDMIVVTLISIVAALFFSFVLHGIFQTEPSVSVNAFRLRIFSFSFIACMCFVMSLEAIVFFNEREKVILRNEKLLRENLEARVEVLRNQLNPHFLFNNLNVLSSLVFVDPVLADKFIIEFSKVYRYALSIQDKNLVNIEEELRFLESYLYLIKQRFHNGLNVNIEVSPESLSDLIPPMTMQVLMENVIQHNQISESRPLNVSIFSHDGKLHIRNEIKEKKDVIESSGIGLNNIFERFKLISKQSPIVSRDDKYFEVSIPLIKPK